MKPEKENNGSASNPNNKTLHENKKSSNFGLNRTLKSLRLANAHQINRCFDKSKEKDSNGKEKSIRKNNDSFATFQKESDSQKETIDTKRLIKTRRKLQLSDAKINGLIHTSSNNTDGLAMINMKKTESISHMSGNYNHLDLNIQNKSQKHINFQKHDFEDWMNSRVTTQEESQLNFPNNSSPTIIVKEQELKRFSHKFARQKIEFEQQIEKLTYRIEELKEMNEQMEKERNSFLSCLRTKENENKQLKEDKDELLNHTYRTERQQNQINTLLQTEIDQKSETIFQLESLLQEKNERMDEILFQLSIKQKEILSYQSKNSSFINHSMTSSIQSKQNNQDILCPQLDIQFWKSQCRKYEEEKNQMSSCMTFLKIEKEHIQRELQLQKQANSDLREQLRELKIFCEVEKNMKQLSCEPVQKLNKSVIENQEILLNKIQDLVYSKQTLERSLQVSSEMILHLKKQNGILKSEIEILQSNEDKEEKIKVEDVKKIIQTMMREQLELQEQLSMKNKSEQNQPIFPIVMNQSLRLKRKFEQGYQSVKQIQRKIKYFKTERTESEDDTPNIKQSFVNQYKSLLDSHNYDTNYGAPSQRQPFFDKS